VTPTVAPIMTIEITTQQTQVAILRPMLMLAFTEALESCVWDMAYMGEKKNMTACLKYID
jgi:hypothetical protein